MINQSRFIIYLSITCYIIDVKLGLQSPSNRDLEFKIWVLETA